MSAKIYVQEIKDGVGGKVEAQASVAYTAEIIIPSERPKIELSDLIEQDHLALASTEPLQEDLFYLKSVLVSTGWNLNDDIFMAEELWKSRKTPEDKQFNFMHDEKDIIGHITSNQIADFEGNLLVDEDYTESVPQEFNIITNAVIYKGWSDILQRERISKLIAEIKQGKWFVSMECIFPDFDYALKNSQGETRIVRREESSAFLTKHLRAYGGTGEFEDYKIGRVLKDLIFSGKGLVNKPANPRSVILQEENQAISYANEQEKDMPVETNKELDQLKSELVDAKAEMLNMKSTIDELNKVKAEVESLQTSVSVREETIASLLTEKETLEQSVASLTLSLEASEQSKAELEQKIKEIEETAKTEKRKAQLVEAGLDQDELDDALASFNDMSAVSFEKMIAVMKKGRKQVSESVDEEESCAEVLENAEEVEDASASVVETEENDPAESLRSEAVSFFEKTLASTKK